MLSGVTLWFNSPEKSTRVEDFFLDCIISVLLERGGFLLSC